MSRAISVRADIDPAGLSSLPQVLQQLGKVVRQKWGRLLNRDPRLFLRVIHTCGARLYQGARTRVPPHFYLASVLCLAQRFLHGHAQLRYKAFLDGLG